MSGPVGSPRPRVLVIEDHADTLELLLLALREHGFEAEGETDGRRAWDRLVELEPQAIVVDLFLPHMAGWRLAELVRLDRRWKRTPIVVLTGSTTPDAVQRAKDAGADLVLFKPCEPERLAMELEGVLARRSAPPRPAPEP